MLQVGKPIKSLKFNSLDASRLPKNIKCAPSEWTTKLTSFALSILTKTPAYSANAFQSTHWSFSCRQAPNTATSQPLMKLQFLWDSSQTDGPCPTKQP